MIFAEMYLHHGHWQPLLSERRKALADTATATATSVIVGPSIVMSISAVAQ